MFRFATANTSRLESGGFVMVDTCRLLGGSIEEREPFGELEMYQSLGVSSMPYPPDEGADPGYAEAVIGKVDGKEVILAVRDTRTAKVVGNLKPGDTVVHSTGPQQAAQVQLKEEKRQVALVTKASDGTTVVQLLDGVNDKVQIAAFGHLFEISKDNGICMVEKTGAAGIQIIDGKVMIMGTVILGGRTPVAPVISGLASPGAPSPGVFIGA